MGFFGCELEEVFYSSLFSQMKAMVLQVVQFICGCRLHFGESEYG